MQWRTVRVLTEYSLSREKYRAVDTSMGLLVEEAVVTLEMGIMLYK